MNNRIVLAAVVVLLVVAGVFVLNRSKPQPSQPTMQIQQTQPTAAETATPEVSNQPTGEQTTQKNTTTSSQSIEIKNFAFNPKTVTVKKGTTVTFTNRDAVGHSATADDGSFDTGILKQNQSGTVTFSKTGTYAYHCTPHPYMKATIVVE